MYYIRETKSEGRPKLHYYQTNENKSVKLFKATLSISELYEMLLSRTDIKFKKTKMTVSTDSERLFKMAVVYGGVRQTLRNTSHVRLLGISKAILSLEEFSLHFWYTEFVSRYLRRNNSVDTFRVSRAFRDLYE